MTVPIAIGGSRLDVLLGELSAALAAADPTPYDEGDGRSTFHPAFVAMVQASEEPDDTAHLAFDLNVVDSPVDGFDRMNSGRAIQFASVCSLVLSYRLRDDTDNADVRGIHSALLDLCRVVLAWDGGWTNDATVSTEITNRGRLVGRDGAWLRYQILFTLRYAEVL